MLTLKEYKRTVIDRTGKATAALINAQGESLMLGDAYEVVNLNNSKLRFKWKPEVAVEQWYPFTHVAFYRGDTVAVIKDILPVNLWENPQKRVELVFAYE